MAIPDYQNQIDGLRAAYVAASPRQRAEIARQRMADPALAVNRLITRVSAVEALARSLALDAKVKAGEKPGDAYGELRHKNAEDLLEEIVAPSHRGIRWLGRVHVGNQVPKPARPRGHRPARGLHDPPSRRHRERFYGHREDGPLT